MQDFRRRPRPRTRLYHPEILQAGQNLTFDRDQAAYLTKVLRLKTGAEIGLFNGQSGEWRAHLEVAGPRAVSAQVGDQVCAAEPAQGPTLAFVPIKKTPMEWLLIKATELGVAALQPLMSDHGQAGLDRPERLQILLQEAAEQSERCHLPAILPLQSLRDWVGAAGPVLVAAEAGQAESPGSLLNGPVPQNLLIGPEGGFSPQEIQMFADMPHIRCLSLGPQILKAETAALTLLTLVQAARGHFDDRPGFRS